MIKGRMWHKMDKKDHELESDEEVTEVDVMEITLSEPEIDDWIGRLEELKDSKSEITLELDDENELAIKYGEEESDDEGEEE